LSFDLAVVGAGAAGLMAAIQAGRAVRARGGESSIVALDGARHLGAKILVAGGGRCNVTHDEVDARDFNGSSAAAIRKVLGRFDVTQTIAFFERAGVRLSREETGKLFPATNRARTVLDALLAACRDARVALLHPWRVEAVVRRTDGAFALRGPGTAIAARRVILAPGGKALPKSGSDGHGFAIARSLGHTTTPVFPALAPLVLPVGSFLRTLPGIAAPARLEVRAATGKRLAATTGALLCTHFGVSGPAVLDISRHLTHARAEDPGAHLVVSFYPEDTTETLMRAILEGHGATAGSWVRRRLPERLADALVAAAGIDPGGPLDRFSREHRRALAATLSQLKIPVTGDRGFTHAEATAGGVPLSEVRLDTMESRICPGLHLCGEILDVDGRIGGFNFQWAWSSGFVAGAGAATLS
jgi:predicted Rossmann fold flavoprotein